MQGENTFYAIDHNNLNTEKDSTAIKSLITRDNDEEEFDGVVEEVGGTEEPGGAQRIKLFRGCSSNKTISCFLFF